MLSHILKIAVVLLVIISGATRAAEPDIVRDGKADLSNWNPKEQGTLNLQGQWEFYWSQLLTPEDFKNQTTKERSLIQVPGSWNKGASYPDKGFATYRLQIRLESVRELALSLPWIPCSSRIYIDDRLVYEGGRVGAVDNSKFYEPGGIEQYLAFTPSQKDFDIVVQTANFDILLAGIAFPIKIGTPAAILQNKERTTVIGTFLVGCLFIMAIYHLCLFALRRKDRSTLYFGLLLLCSCGYMLGSTGSGIFIFLPDINFIARFRLYSSWVLGAALFAYFGRELFPRYYAKQFPHWIAAVCFPIYILVLLTEPRLYLPWTLLSNIAMLISSIYTFFVLNKALRAGDDGARIFACGCIIAIFASFHDILLAKGWIQSVPLLGLGLFLFVFVQSVLLARRFSNAFVHVEYLLVEVEEREKSRTLFFHNTSHELRTPLNGILGFLDLIRAGHYGSLPDRARIQIDKTWRLAESLKIQVNTILDLAKSKRGELKLVANLNDLQEFKRSCDLLAEGLQLKFSGTHYESILEDIAGTRRWRGDKEKTLTIVRNLLGNAFKFRSLDRDNLVKLILLHRQGQLEIQVSDQGIGIALADQGRIFDEFSQAESDARRSYEGTGLGLSMVRDLVALSGGSIRLESEPGKGSCFYISLPELPEETAIETEIIDQGKIAIQGFEQSELLPANETAQKSSASRLFCEQFRILIVDDNATNLEVIHDVLEMDGYELELADGGKKAIDSLRLSIPDLLILDLMMPEVSGEDVLRFVRRDKNLAELPVIVLTARASDQDRLVGLGFGADDYMSKPFNPKEMSLKVHNTLERRDIQRRALDIEHHARLVELGSLFSDLSHEIKNVLQVVPVHLTKLAETHKALWNRPDLNPALSQKLQEISETPELNLNRHVLFKKMLQELSESIPGENGRRAARILSSSQLSDEALLSIWQGLLALPTGSFASVQDLLDIVELFNTERMALHRTRELALSALDYERMGQTKGKAQLEEVIQSIGVLLGPRFKKVGADFQYIKSRLELPISPGILQQVLINLLGNACDALTESSDKERWIRLALVEKSNEFLIQVSNAGPKIPQAIAKKLFQRGFSTKGQQGSGLGLALSRRLLREQGADLILDDSAEHTVFVISLNKSAEAKTA